MSPSGTGASSSSPCRKRTAARAGASWTTRTVRSPRRATISPTRARTTRNGPATPARRGGGRRERIGKPQPRRRQPDGEHVAGRRDPGGLEHPAAGRRRRAGNAPQLRRDRSGMRAAEVPDARTVLRLPGRAESGRDVPAARIDAQRGRVQQPRQRRLVARARERGVERPRDALERDAQRVRRSVHRQRRGGGVELPQPASARTSASAR